MFASFPFHADKYKLTTRYRGSDGKKNVRRRWNDDRRKWKRAFGWRSIIQSQARDSSEDARFSTELKFGMTMCSCKRPDGDHVADRSSRDSSSLLKLSSSMIRVRSFKSMLSSFRTPSSSILSFTLDNRFRANFVSHSNLKFFCSL